MVSLAAQERPEIEVMVLFVGIHTMCLLVTCVTKVSPKTLQCAYNVLNCLLNVKRGTWNGMERGMEHRMERGTDVKCRNESNKRIN